MTNPQGQSEGLGEQRPSRKLTRYRYLGGGLTEEGSLGGKGALRGDGVLKLAAKCSAPQLGCQFTALAAYAAIVSVIGQRRENLSRFVFNTHARTVREGPCKSEGTWDQEALLV
jgi:hypothetical protein